MKIKKIIDVANEMGCTRQYIYSEKKLFNIIELPVFVEYEGVRYEIGKQKFVLQKEKKNNT